MFTVCKLCEKQLKDVNPNDILNDGLYRRCNTYKGGGGYDKFPEIYKRRNSDLKDLDGLNDQFVVQLYGCPLNCPYCYVTRDGVFGETVSISVERLVQDFIDSGCKVFHLMGGAPDMYIDKWSELIEALPEGTIFHSNLLCQGSMYKASTLRDLAKFPRALYAVSVKGGTSFEFYKNTRTRFDENAFWSNLANLVFFEIPFYITYTGMSKESINLFEWKVVSHFPSSCEGILLDSFPIDLVHYNALD